MKKLTFCVLSVLCASLFFFACSGEKRDFLKEFKAGYDEIVKEGNSWSVDQWEATVERISNLELAFYQSMPTKEQYEEFEKIELDAESFSEETFEKIEMAIDRFYSKHEGFDEERDKAYREMRKNWGEEFDEEEEYEFEDFDFDIDELDSDDVPEELLEPDEAA